MPLWLFIFVAALSIIAALGVILQRHPVHCLLALVMTLVLLAILFIGLGATTVGFLQVIVYAGAIMVLFLFVIWLLNLQAQPLEGGHLALKFVGSLATAALIAELLVFVLHLPAPLGHNQPVGADYGSIGLLARSLFSDYLVAFEVTSVLLLVGVVGAVALARRTVTNGVTKAPYGAGGSS
jgi:NADH-quinone oxidoreductase subunit J